MNYVEEIETLPNVVYYNDDHSNTPTCTVEMGETLKLTFTAPSTWKELVTELEAGAKYLAFHADMIERSTYRSPRDFLDAIKSICRYIPASRDLRIVVVIKPTTPLTIIHALQKAGCQGLVLDLNYWTPEQAAAGGNALLNGIQYWPKHILDQLPVGRPLSVYFRQDWDEYRKTIDMEKFQKIVEMDLDCRSSWDSLTGALNRNPHQLIFHITELERMDVTISEIVTMLKTKLKMANVDIPIGVGILPTTTAAQIKELKRAGIHSIIPNAADWGIQETINGIHSLRDRTPYWPKHILDQLPGAKKKKANAENITLTDRQGQVFKLIIERGSSNKVIARSLGISESTVKLHLTEIFKKYGVKNRTQLAVFSNVS